MIDPLQYEGQRVSERFLGTGYRFVKGSIYDTDLVSGVVGRGDVVVHLAAEVNSFASPQDRTNDDPVRYLETLSNVGIGRLVFMSSADVYGTNESADLVEADSIRPTTIYSAAKAAFEAYISAFIALRGLPAVVFRPVTIYGPNQYPGWLVPIVITRALAGKGVVLTGSGTARRDWIHVDDLCEVLYRAIMHRDATINGQIFNIGTGTESTVLELAQHVFRRIGASETGISFVPDRPGDVPRQVTSAGRAREFFDWQPTVTLYDGLDATIEWYRQHHHPPLTK